jgi:transposase-like protein
MGKKFRKSSVDVTEAVGEGTSTEAAEVPERWSSGKKAEVVLRLLRGEDVGTVSRQVGVAAHELEEWRRVFIEGGKTGLKGRGEPDAERELTRARAKVGELMMELELTEGLLKKRGFGDDLKKLGR